MRLVNGLLVVSLMCASASAFATKIVEDNVFNENILKQQASVLNLSFAEVKKYHEVLNSPLGHFYKRGEANIFYVLAAEAESESERMRFARLWVKAEEQYYNKLGKAMNAYTKASIERFGASPKVWNMTAYDDLVTESKLSKTKPQKRAKLYVNTKNCNKCLVQFVKLNEKLSTNILSGIDIYFLDVGSDKGAIAKWAIGRGISQALVKQKNITLNFDDGKSKEKAPYVKEYYILN